MRNIILIVILLALCPACAHLPAGWSESESPRMDAVAAACGDIVYGAAEPDDTLRALRSIGWVGAKSFVASSQISQDLEMRLQGAVTAMDVYARNTYMDLFRETSLGGVIRAQTGVDANDADQVLGLLWAALWNAHFRDEAAFLESHTTRWRSSFPPV